MPRSPEAPRANTHRWKALQVSLLPAGLQPDQRPCEACQKPRAGSVWMRSVRRVVPIDARAAWPLRPCPHSLRRASWWVAVDEPRGVGTAGGENAKGGQEGEPMLKIPWTWETNKKIPPGQKIGTINLILLSQIMDYWKEHQIPVPFK